MLELSKAAFSYLAFNDATQEVMAYGTTAHEASQSARKLDACAKLRVIPAGQYGRTIWKRKISLRSAERALERARAQGESLASRHTAPGWTGPSVADAVQNIDRQLPEPGAPPGTIAQFF